MKRVYNKLIMSYIQTLNMRHTCSLRPLPPPLSTNSSSTQSSLPFLSSFQSIDVTQSVPCRAGLLIINEPFTLLSFYLSLNLHLYLPLASPQTPPNSRSPSRNAQRHQERGFGNVAAHYDGCGCLILTQPLREGPGRRNIAVVY